MKIENYSGDTVVIKNSKGIAVSIDSYPAPTSRLSFETLQQQMLDPSGDLVEIGSENCRSTVSVFVNKEGSETPTKLNSFYVVEGLPAPEEGTVYIVPETICLILQDRTDLIFVRKDNKNVASAYSGGVVKASVEYSLFPTKLFKY